MLNIKINCLLLIILCVLRVIQSDGDDDEDEAPYTVEIDNFEISTEYDYKFINWDTLGLKKKKRNQFVISGNVILNLNLADDQKVSKN